MKEGLLPRGYHDYFMMVYKEAKSMDEIGGLGQSQSTLQIISGQGFFDFQNGGFIRYGQEKLSFEEIGKTSSASVLNILDISYSPHAAACFNGMYPTGDPAKLKWKHVFRNREIIKVRVACDKSPSTWAFRIGYGEQPEDDKDKDHWIRMSAPIGDAVTSCVLMAIKSFAESNFEAPSLDTLFLSYYYSLRTGYLSTGSYTPKGFSDLKRLEQLIKEHALSLDLSTFDCELFRRQGKWFLTHERVTVLGDSDEALATVVIDYVAKLVKTWHETHPNSLKEIADSRDAWIMLLKTLG